MCNSSNLITLKDMALCLSDARVLLLNGDIEPGVYMELLEEAAKQLRPVLMFVDRLELSLDEDDEKEIEAILCHLEVATTHRYGPCFQGGDFGLYLSLQDPVSVPPVDSGPGALDNPARVVWELIGFDFNHPRLRAQRDHSWGTV